MMNALSEHGNHDAWYTKFKEIRDLNYKPFKLATATLLASVILPMLPKQDGFITDLYGGSGHGKSAMLSIVSTILVIWITGPAEFFWIPRIPRLPLN